MGSGKIMKIKIGDMVKSHYRAGWVGVVMDLEKRGKFSDLATIKVLSDRNGNELRKPMIKTLDVGWLTAIKEE
jgi:hypothetical protein